MRSVALNWQFFTFTPFGCKWLEGAGQWRSKNTEFRKIWEFDYKPGSHLVSSPAAPRWTLSVTAALPPSTCAGKLEGAEWGINERQLTISGVPGYQFWCQKNWNFCCGGKKSLILELEGLSTKRNKKLWDNLKVFFSVLFWPQRMHRGRGGH